MTFVRKTVNYKSGSVGVISIRIVLFSILKKLSDTHVWKI